MSQRKIREIRKLYDETTPRTVERDLTRAVEILKTLPDEDTRARAAAFMDGLSQLRSEWRLEKQRKANKSRRIAAKGTGLRRGKKKTSRPS